MSKVICDVCGTAFPETDNQCPICGCAKTPTAQPVAEETVQPEAEKTVGGTYAKGGRYAKSNTKHTPAYAASKTSERRRRNDHKDEEPQESNKGLVAVVIVLLLAIVMVVVYIGVSVFLSGLTILPNNDSSNPSTEQTLESTEATTEQVPCTDLKLGSMTIEFEQENQSCYLDVKEEPENTTDKVVFASADSNVATVDQNGLIVPVGHGQTVITVTCGQIVKECIVICSFGEPDPTTEPTKPPVNVPDGFVLELNRKDFTLSFEGETWRLFRDTDTVKASDITWTVDDPAIATVVNGVVTGVDRGTTTVTATIGDQVSTCIVRCAFDAADPDEEPGITINREDVTLYAGENFYLYLKNPDTSNVQGVEWTASEESLVEIDGNKITALDITAYKQIEIYTEHEGVTYSCTLRLYPPKQEATESGT